jgi:opacity protein-like surface antigen
MSTIKKLFVALSLVVLVSSMSYAQYSPVNTGFDGPRPEVKKGSKAMVFIYSPFVSSDFGSAPVATVITNFDTTNIGATSTGTTTGIGLKFFLNNQWSISPTLQFSTGSLSQTLTGGTVESSNTSFGFAVDLDYHLKALYGVDPYIGLNLGFASIKSEFTSTSAGTTSTSDFTTSGIGVGIQAGFQWFFTEGLSLGGKYTIGANILSSPERTSTGGTVSTTSTGPDGSIIQTGNASIMLNVHF